MKLALRFNMRAPSIGAPADVQYPVSVDMCAWADRLGFETVYLSEHHGTDDGYGPAPVVHAAAIASRTNRMRLHFSLLVAPLHHPLRLAEQLAVLDLLSEGRVDLTLGLGYREAEYAMFGVDKTKRVAMLEETVRVLNAAWTGEPFEFRGTKVVVRPRPVQRPRPRIFLGGSSSQSAYRAARIADGYRPVGDGLYEVYAAERLRLGLPPAAPLPTTGPLFVFISQDPERDWARLGPCLMHTTNSSAAWVRERGIGSTPFPMVDSIEGLRADRNFQVLMPEECVALARKLGDRAELSLHPLMGGIDSDLGWSSLELFESAVLPRLIDMGLRPNR